MTRSRIHRHPRKFWEGKRAPTTPNTAAALQPVEPGIERTEGGPTEFDVDTAKVVITNRSGERYKP